jgi:hypothetical protein
MMTNEPEDFGSDHSNDADRTDTSDERVAGGETTPFDPSRYMRQLRGRGGSQDYLDVKFRLLWLRREHPDAEILTEHVRIDDTTAIFKATVTIPGGGKATGYGSETAADFGDFIEKAETKAIGRALNALGYGAQFAEGDEDTQPAPSMPPARRQTAPTPPPASAKPPLVAADTTPPAAQRRPAASPTPLTQRATSARPAAPIDITSAGRERPGPEPKSPARPAAEASARPAQPAADTSTESEPPLEDYSWTAFWRWARPLGFENRGAIEALIGASITNMNPAQVRDLIKEKRGEDS